MVCAGHNGNSTRYGYAIVLWSFFIQAIAVGLGLSYGVLHIEFMDYFKQPAADTSLVGSINNGVSLISGPAVSALSNRLGLRQTVLLGALISTAGLLASSFATSLYWLYISYGFVAGFGYGMVYMPLIGIITSYFEKHHRDIALCLASTGIGVGVLVFPPVIERLIEHLSWRGTLLILSGLAFQICVFAALSPPRQMPSESSFKDSLDTIDTIVQFESFRNYFKQCDCALLKNWRFIVILAAEILWNMALCIVMSHLPHYARSYGHAQRMVCWLLSIIGILGTAGRIIMAVLGAFKKLHKTTIVFACSLLSAVSLIMISELKSNFIALSASVGIFGFTHGTKYALLTCVMASMFGADKSVAAVGYLSVSVGIGQATGPPIGGMMYDLTGYYPSAFLLGSALAFLSTIIYIPLLVHQKRQRNVDAAIVEMTYSLEMLKRVHIPASPLLSRRWVSRQDKEEVKHDVPKLGQNGYSKVSQEAEVA
ncbi:monocarboxylate transporter 13-like [Tubulanus polymorphus]|uniref:monocarboxylate transporter 13-like n=1 Tax=Tubulanus polymorphus TaxID=672921 RepID=UPI003DA34294